jgi:uncharacterized membrane protein YoaK (UPF0700 family)
MLTFSAGMVDIVGYIALYHWFVAHMTGDTVHLGNQLVTGNWSEAEKAATVIGSFILGWWRRRESNPRPKMLLVKRLHA